MKQFCISALMLVALSACDAQKPAPEDSNAAAPAPAPMTAKADSVLKDDFPQVLQASGTEPFWGVRVDGGKLDYTTPETQDAPRHFEGERTLNDGLLVVQGGEGDAAFRLTLEHAPCSDGMSDLSHPYTAEFVLGKDTFKGCARDPAVAVEAP
ncbi:hypothetical protein [Stenotrophomonas sp.]|uniref:COG3650 family protein n=1 Tax=Stenotrophomonas sp. TaxID=69392 RepID=UPI0028B02619|nr:hypothetical protein [Stenotrophomonas sp.]